LHAERSVIQQSAEQAKDRRTLHPELMALAFGPDLAILGLPGEFFAETAEDIRRHSGIRDLLIACYANHCAGCVCPPAVYEEGGYEAGHALCAEAESVVKRSPRRAGRRRGASARARDKMGPPSRRATPHQAVHDRLAAGSPQVGRSTTEPGCRELGPGAGHVFQRGGRSRRDD
jgi:hypothetical protein